MKQKLIKRTYRITTDNEKVVKKNKKKFGSESEFIRDLIKDYDIQSNHKLLPKKN